MDYPEIAIQALINCLDDDQEAYDWLVQSKYKELAAFADFVCSKNPQALQFLLVNKDKFSTIVNFLAALQQEPKAFELLMASKDRKWAAVVNAIHGSDEAYNWLVDNNLDVYAKLAVTFIKNQPLTRQGRIIYGGFYGKD